MNEGEKQKKKVYKRGDVVTFRLLKKFNYSNEVIDFLNAANKKDELNVEIIEAIELYAKYKKFRKTLHGTSINEYEVDFFKIMPQARKESKELDNSELINKNKEEVLLDPKLTKIVKESNRIEEKAPEVVEKEIQEENQDRKVIKVPSWNQSDKNTEDAADELFNIYSSKDKPADEFKGNGMAKAFKSLRKL